MRERRFQSGLRSKSAAEQKVHFMGFSRGKTTEKKKRSSGPPRKTATKISWLPDPEIFLTTREFKYDLLAKRLRELAFLNPGIEIILEDGRSGRKETFLFKDGIAPEYVQFLNRGKTRRAPLGHHPQRRGPRPWKRRKTASKLSSISPCNTTTATSDQLYAYANSIHNVEGGTHT